MCVLGVVSFGVHKLSKSFSLFSDDESDGDESDNNNNDDDDSRQDLTLKTEEDEELDADDSVKDQLMGDAESEPKKPEAKVAPPASRVVSLPASVAASAGALYRTPPVFRTPRPFMPSVGSDGEYYPDHMGNWKPWFVKPFWTDTNMNTHQSFWISLPSGVGYEDSGDVTPTLVQHGVATYLSIHINLPEWIARELFLPFLKTTWWDNVKHLVIGMSDDQRQAFKSNANDDFVLLSHALRGELAAKVKGSNDDYPELDDECKLRVDMEVQPLRDDDWDIVGNKADGIRYLFVDLKAAVNELSKDKSKIKRSKLQGVKGK